MELYFCVIAGAIAYILFSLNNVYGKPEFSWDLFLKQNWLPAVTNLFCGALLVWRRADIEGILPFTGLWAVFFGFAGQALLKQVFKIFDSKFQTYIGVNKVVDEYEDKD